MLCWRGFGVRPLRRLRLPASAPLPFGVKLRKIFPSATPHIPSGLCKSCAISRASAPPFLFQRSSEVVICENKQVKAGRKTSYNGKQKRAHRKDNPYSLSLLPHTSVAPRPSVMLSLPAPFSNSPTDRVVQPYSSSPSSLLIGLLVLFIGLNKSE